MVGQIREYSIISNDGKGADLRNARKKWITGGNDGGEDKSMQKNIKEYLDFTAANRFSPYIHRQDPVINDWG